MATVWNPFGIDSRPRFGKTVRPQNGKKEDGAMSQHASLKSANKIATRRNVLKRFERVDLLKKRGKWKDGDRGLGLPKTKPE